MARSGVTTEQVRQAVEELEAEGVGVSVQSIRTKLGTGSYTTIQAALDQWRAEQNAQHQPVVPEVPPKLLALTRSVWTEAWKTASEAFAAEKKGLAEEKAKFEKDRNELSAEIARLERDLQSADDSVGQAEQRNKSLAEELAAGQLAATREASSRAAMESECERLRQDRQTIQQQLTEWVERATRAETRLEASSETPQSRDKRR